MIDNIKDIQEQFNEVLCYSQHQASVNTDNLFAQWAKAKQKFIDGMGGQLILQVPTPVTVNLTGEARERRIDEFIDVVNEISNDIGEFFTAERAGLLDNKTCVQYGEVPAGIKLGKALHRYFNDCCSKIDREWIIQELSRLIQENSLSGYLCFSVHPLDFLSLSENNNNWRSCHALNGDYRSGNLSYMCDEVTAIAYLKTNDDDNILPRFPDSVPWNNKKWRCLLFFDQERGLVWAGRPYPFGSDSLIEAVREQILVPQNYFDPRATGPYGASGWRKETFKTFMPCSDGNVGLTHELNYPYLYNSGNIMPLNTFVQSHKDSCAFNDLLDSHYYTPIFLTYEIKSHWIHHFNQKIPPMIVGNTSYCIHCGEKNFYDSCTMFCADDVTKCEDEDIDGIYYCVECQDRIIEENVFYFHSNVYCEDCYNALKVKYCERCGTEVASAYEGVEDKEGHFYCSDYCRKQALYEELENQENF